MRLKELEILRLPGVDESFRLSDELSSGLNLIVGPNGSGKTSICRAVRAILWPEAPGPSLVWLASEWRWRDETITAEREGREPAQFRDRTGQAVPVALPAAHLAHCFTIDVLDLVKADRDTGDDELAGAVRQKMSGGFDLPRIIARRFAHRPRFADPEARALADRRRGLTSAKDRQRQLANNERSLEALRERQEEIRGAGRRVLLLEKVEQLHATRKQTARVRVALESFPPGMELLTGLEEQQLAELEEDLANARTGCRETENRIEELEDELASGASPATRIDDSDFALWHETAHRLEQTEREIGAAELALAEAMARVAAARAALDPDAVADSAPSSSVELVRDAESYLRRRTSLGAERDALEAWRRRLARRRIPERTGTAPDPTTITLAVVIAIVAAALGTTVAVAFWALLGIAALVVLVPEVATRRAVVEARSEYERLGEHETERVMTDLEELERRDAKLDREGSRLRERLGVDADLGDVDVVEISRRLEQWRAADQDAAGKARRLDALREDFDQGMSELQAFFAQHAIEPVDAPTAARLRLATLREHCRAHRLAAASLVKERRARSKLEGQIETLEERRAAFFARIGLSEGEVPELLARLGQRDAFQKERASYARLLDRAAEIEDELSSHEELLDLDGDELQERIAAEQQLDREFQELGEKIGGIVHEVERTVSGDEIERALDAVADAEGELAELRATALRRAAGRYLLDRVRERHRREYQPVLLGRANELFGTFTNHEYELRVDEEADSGFVAVDVRADRTLGLSELSLGTRSQLLLAARLAFAFEVERGEELPLFLDETLAHSDPGRFAAVAKSLLELVQEQRRQIFYLTSDAADVARFHRVQDELGMQRTAPIDLAEVRARGKQLEAAEYELPRPQLPQPPRDRSPAEYAEAIGVARFDPYGPSGRVHLFHLLREDLGSLHRLLVAGITSLGQWRQVRGLERLPTGIDEHVATRLDVAADLCDAFLSAWQIGRSRPVDRNDLEASGAVSDRFLDEVARKRSECAGDPAHLIGALERGEVKRFRSESIDQLRDYFVTRGYLDERRQLDADEVRMRVIHAIGAHLAAGRVELDRVRRIVDELWRLAATATSSASMPGSSRRG